MEEQRLFCLLRTATCLLGQKCHKQSLDYMYLVINKCTIVVKYDQVKKQNKQKKHTWICMFQVLSLHNFYIVSEDSEKSAKDFKICCTARVQQFYLK